MCVWVRFEGHPFSQVHCALRTALFTERRREELMCSRVYVYKVYKKALKSIKSIKPVCTSLLFGYPIAALYL